MGRYSLVPLRHLWLCPLSLVAITAAGSPIDSNEGLSFSHWYRHNVIGRDRKRVCTISSETQSAELGIDLAGLDLELFAVVS
jgi:hypothetical protein